jgi:hypothetical protein
MDIVNKLRMCTEELHSVGGFNGYASAMSLAADEIERLRQAVLDEREATVKQYLMVQTEGLLFTTQSGRNLPLSCFKSTAPN